MLTSKSFGYAVRGLLFIAIETCDRNFIQLDVIAAGINGPKHFLAKIFKKLAEAGWVESIKGPHGGFRANERTLNGSLFELLLVTDPNDPLDHCILKWKQCNSKRPCPIHHMVTPIKNDLIKLLKHTNIKEFISGNSIELLKQIVG